MAANRAGQLVKTGEQFLSAFFERLVEEGEIGLQDLMDRRQQEHVELDFKRKSDPSHPNLNDDDRRTLGEALSGFSNSAGGTLIWGVDARKIDGVDCAAELMPISNIEAFRSNVQSLIGQYLMPRHEGVRTGIVNSVSDPSRGYLLVDVDRSERRPHRSEAKGKKGYFKRAGDSFFEMEHYDIEDAFKRIHVPELQFRYKLRVSTNGYGVTNGVLSLRLHNQSAKSARYPYLHLKEVGAGARLDRALPYNGYEIHQDWPWIRCNGGANAMVHPETSSAIIQIPIEVRTLSGRKINDVEADQYRLQLEYRFGCEDSRLRGDIFKLSAGEIFTLLSIREGD